MVFLNCTADGAEKSVFLPHMLKIYAKENNISCLVWESKKCIPEKEKLYTPGVSNGPPLNMCESNGESLHAAHAHSICGRHEGQISE